MSSKLDVSLVEDGDWYRWEVKYGNRRHLGCARQLERAFEDCLASCARIKLIRLNPPRNP